MRKIQNDELGRLTVDDFKLSVKQSIILVLDNVRSLGNVGSVLRSADAFRCEAVYLCGITGTPPHREIHKTALGAEESVEWKYFKTTGEALHSLKKQDYRIVAVEQADGAIALENFECEKNESVAFVFGHEINGVSTEALSLCDEAVYIPQFGTKHSLNVSVCAGIICWAVTQLKNR